jgi:hypothetical protein
MKKWFLVYGRKDTVLGFSVIAHMCVFTFKREAVLKTPGNLLLTKLNAIAYRP